MATPKRRRVPAAELGRVEAMADDLLHYASGAGWIERDINTICTALGWPKIGRFQQGVRWAVPARNYADCDKGGREHRSLERLRGAGLALYSGTDTSGRREYEITAKGQAAAYLRHMAVREALKVLT